MNFLKKLFENKKPKETLKPLTQEEFSTHYFKAFQEKIPTAKLLSYNDLELEIDFGDESGNTFKQFLGNAFAEYNNSPKKIEEICERYLNSSLNIFKESEEKVTQEQIIPMIKNIDFLRSNIELNPKAEQEMVFEQLNEELYIFYVINSETSLKYINKDNLEELNVTTEKIREIAVRNLVNLTESNIERHGDNGYYMLTFDGNFEASLLLLDIWNKDNFNVDGDFVIAIPSRDVLLISGSNDKDNILKMKDSTIEICQSGDHLVSENLFILKDGKIEIFA